MSGLELNKIVAAILLASLIAMLVGFTANILYKPKLEIAERGYQIEVEEGEPQNPGEKPEPIDIPKLMAEANAENGAKIVKKCVSCHSFNQGGANKVGPNLFAIVDSKKAAKSSFVYSKTLASMGGSWSIENLYHFLNKPSKYAPGTKMSFAGLRKPTDIADVIAYLKQNAK
ncbi:MAG: hypothetical protein DGJ47_000206 [Rickettsiaceae bacterium]